MTQLTLDGKELTKLIRLRQLRLQYYKEFIQDIETHKILLKQKTQSYINTVKSIDNEIKQEVRKQKQKNC